ncbi:immunoglobulin-like and fibronectin type III domain-containing protein 1 [Stegostoma tigrinum]|uniref:immunoglobulin-like and fibronectin type III domain-containing protein 1 n=1 Tax=Stegostoma tigrinum TaxID=3053191 RepID=UPI00286FF740|nr:immunoglobulin-like and fibronectin type III domain-containing protein 1 [Stegostoma tigrinum]
MEKKVSQLRNSAKPGGKTRRSSTPGVIIIEFTETIPQECSAPDIERRPIPLTMQEGKSANFKAAVRGNPEPTLVWSFNGKNLSNSNKYNISYDRIMKEHILQVKQLTIDDAGSYKCTVSNEYGEARCATNLNIIEVGYKKKLKRPGEVQDKSTDPTDFRKMLKKRAPPPVKKGQKVPDEKVWEILMHADKKDYERICMEYGLTDFRGMLTKLNQMKKDREEKQAQYVKEISNLKHVETKSDGSATFGFDLELKSPKLNIYLYKDGKLIPHSLDADQKHYLKHVGKRYTFCIKDLQLDDVGLYKVTVEDAEVFATEVDISLIPVNFTCKLQAVKCKEGNNAIFECDISLPIPAEWSYKKIPLENSDKYEIKVSPDGLKQSLIIKNVRSVDKGVYTVSAGAGFSSAYLSVEKNRGTASPSSLRKEIESDYSQEDFSDITLEQELEDTTKGGLKAKRSLHDEDLIIKDDMKQQNHSSEKDSINFGRGVLQRASMDGLDGATKSDQSAYDRIGKADSGSLKSVGKGGFDGLDGMGRDGRDGRGRLDGVGRGGKGGLDGMGRDGKGGLGRKGRDDKDGLDGIGRDGKGGLDRMGRNGGSRSDGMGRDNNGGLLGIGKVDMGRLKGMGRDEMDRMGAMGRGDQDRLDGMRRDGKDGLDGIGRGSKGGLDRMGRSGMDGLDGMGRVGKDGLDRMGRGGRDDLEGMGRDGKDGLDGMGISGKSGLDGMGRDSKGGLDGMGRGGKDGLNGMGSCGRGILDEKGKGGKGGLEGMGRDGEGRMGRTRKDGHDRMYDDGIDNLTNLDGSGRGNQNESKVSAWREVENNLPDGSNQGKDSSMGYNNVTSPGRGQDGLNDIHALSVPGDLSNRSNIDGSTKGGYALSEKCDQKSLQRRDQMSNQGESMAGGYQDALTSDASQTQPSGSSRRRSGKFSESDINEADLDVKHKEPARRFKRGLLDVSVRKGQAAELCCVTANENTRGTWFKNGTKITPGDGKSVTKEGAIQKLIIPNVKEEDSGVYTFEADGGKTEASLFVKDPPEFDQDVLDQLGKKDTIIKAGQTATVKVPFSGKPPMKVSWYKDGEELFEDNRISIDNSKTFTRLSISKCNRKDSGKMTVKLKNESGSTSANINLAVIDKPQAPQGPLLILASLENCISFKWKPPKDDGGKPIQHYVIEKQQVGRNTSTKIGEVDEPTTTFSFDKAEPGKKYKFKIWAVNSEGISGALLSEAVTAGRKDVPGSPAKPNILSSSNKSITVSWTPPHNTGSSRIIGYIIEKRRKGSNIWSAVTDTPVTGKKWTITDVVEGFEYEFRVTAVNSSGPGDPSCESEAAFAREPMKVPGTVRDLRVTDSTYSTISLSWNPPIYKGSDVPKGYIVEMKSSDSTTWTRCNSAAVGLNSYTVKGLNKMGMYFLRVRAVNDGGMGEPIELDSYVLAMPPPVCPKFKMNGSVKNFMIIKEGNSLRVQMPFEASPPPEVIWLKDGFPVSEQATITSTSGSTQLFIPVSQRSHSGIYSVTLKNLLGQESFSFEIRVTAVPKLPGPVTLTENVPNTVTVSWEPSSDEPLDDHLHYVVMQRDSHRLKWYTVRDNIFNNKFTVINIVPGCKYYFRVLAKSDMGCSEPSETREPWCISRQRDPFALKFPIYKARSNITAPEFFVRLKTHIAPSGSDINMSCAVKGFPPPKVTWFKDNINIMDDANFWSTNIYGVCSLCIFAASPKQTGEYMAIAENSVGRAITKTRLLVTE